MSKIRALCTQFVPDRKNTCAGGSSISCKVLNKCNSCGRLELGMGPRQCKKGSTQYFQCIKIVEVVSLVTPYRGHHVRKRTRIVEFSNVLRRSTFQNRRSLFSATFSSSIIAPINFISSSRMWPNRRVFSFFGPICSELYKLCSNVHETCSELYEDMETSVMSNSVNIITCFWS